MKCVICGKEIENPYGFTLVGHNPDPVSKTGRCCDDCNYAYVIPARYQRLNAELPAKLADERARS